MIGRSEYRLVSSTTPEGLEQEVNRGLAEGWLAHGNLVIRSYADHSVIFYQPMTRRWLS